MTDSKTMHEYYDFGLGLDLKQNVFLTKVIRKHRLQATRYENAYAYMTIGEKKSLLGNPTYKKRLEELLNRKLIIEVPLGKNEMNANQILIGYIPSTLTYTRKKAYLPSLDRYNKILEDSLSPEAGSIYQTLLHSQVDITEEQLPIALRQTCTRNGRTDHDKYLMDNIAEIQERILDFNHNSSMYVVEDKFGDRVHTFASGLHQEIRKNNLLIYGNKTIELDLHQSQMVILGKIMKEYFGANSFSDLVEKEDVYTHFGKLNGITQRSEAKKLMFRALFDRKGSKADLMLKTAFSDSYEFIANIKSIKIGQNPSLKGYSNLSFMLQREESGIFRDVWKTLITNNIPFLTAHDSIIVEKQNESMARQIMTQKLTEQIGSHITIC
ncbi:MAG: hypothetical protein WC341_01095 [Bacteroidales bacterium]|jgi:hypothetical protein